MAIVTAPTPVAPPAAPVETAEDNNAGKVGVHKKIKYPCPANADGTEGKFEFWPGDEAECKAAGLVEPWNGDKYRIIPAGDFGPKHQHVPMFREAEILKDRYERKLKEAEETKANPTQRVKVKKLESFYSQFKELEASLKAQGVDTAELLKSLAENKS